MKYDAEEIMKWLCETVFSPASCDSFAGSTGHIDLHVSQPQTSASHSLT